MVGEDAHLPPSVPSRAMSGRMKEEERREHWEPVTKTGIRNISVTMGATRRMSWPLSVGDQYMSC